jgi:hypothetical protein
MQPHAYPDRPAAECILPRLRARDGVRGAWKGDEERVALRVDLDASVSLERLAECAPVLREHVGVLLPELLQEPRRALDVGEEKGDRS